MAPLTPHWQQPSHPDIQEVIINEAEFSSKSLSKVALPPFAVYAKLSFPPCTIAAEPTYATVQMGRDSHLSLNSDLLFINHSCEPSLIFDTGNMNVLAGPKGLRPGDELSFFYPSTEWHMAQPFECACGTPTCRGTISGARTMLPQQLEGIWLNGHIRAMLEEKSDVAAAAAVGDPTTVALRDAVSHAEKVVDAARLALARYVASSPAVVKSAPVNGTKRNNGFAHHPDDAAAAAWNRRGPTSRELSGEMGGDTALQV